MTARTVDDERALDRIIFFSDAVFAIAMTLLVLDLRVPLAGAISDRALWHALGRQLPSFWSFALSFFVIGILWMAHQRKFRLIRRYDDRMLWLNLLFLFCIAFLPYPTAVLGRTGGRAATILYASSMAMTGIVSWLLTIYAFGKYRLIDPDVEPSLVSHWSRRAASLPLVFLISIPVAFASPVVARYLWLLVFVLTAVLERVQRRRHPGYLRPRQPSGGDKSLGMSGQ